MAVETHSARLVGREFIHGKTGRAVFRYNLPNRPDAMVVVPHVDPAAAGQPSIQKSQQAHVEQTIMAS